MTVFSKLLPLVAILGTLMVTPGAMPVDRDCYALCSQHQNAGYALTCRDVMKDYGGFCVSDNSARDERSDGYGSGRDGWTRPVPDLRRYGLY
jgi:hypothetical protein